MGLWPHDNLREWAIFAVNGPFLYQKNENGLRFCDLKFHSFRFNTFITVHLLIFVVKPQSHFVPPLMEFSGFIFFDRILGFSVFYLYMCFVQICLNFVQICLKFSTVRTAFWHRSNVVLAPFERRLRIVRTVF